MTALELYKYIHENDIEWRWDTHNDTGAKDVLVLPYTFQIEGFNKLLKGAFDDGGIACHMMDGYLAFWMEDICSHFGIELKEVFTKESSST